jgi:CrcB protein
MIATAWFGAAFPWGTLFINILGSFIIGLFFALTGPQGRLDFPLDARLFVMTGICGGYTTFRRCRCSRTAPGCAAGRISRLRSCCA